MQPGHGAEVVDPVAGKADELEGCALLVPLPHVLHQRAALAQVPGAQLALEVGVVGVDDELAAAVEVRRVGYDLVEVPVQAVVLKDVPDEEGVGVGDDDELCAHPDQLAYALRQPRDEGQRLQRLAVLLL